jgi:hypothetical protein
MMMDPTQLAGWVPIRLYWQGTQPMVDWCYLGGLRFKAPFFEQTIGEALRRPFGLLFRPQTPIEFLGEIAAHAPGLAPAGFIFHMSRCGSTLISQMLAALPRNLVVSEAGPIDFVVRARDGSRAVSEEEQTVWLRWIVNVLGRQRALEQDRYFIKFDSWHTLYLSLILRAFPEVPWVFVYREPIEVMVSHRRQPGAQMVPGLIDLPWTGLEPGSLHAMGHDEYCARLLGRILDAALAHVPDSRGMLINYADLPQAAAATIPDFFGIPCSPEDLGRMSQVTGFQAKNPLLSFEPDAEEKRKAATDRLRQMADHWVRPRYDRLEQLRQGSGRVGPTA